VRNWSIKAKLIVTINIIVFALALILISISIYDIKNTAEENIKIFEKKSYDSRKNELKSNTSIVLKTIEAFYLRTEKKRVKEEVKSKLTTQANMLNNILKEYYDKHKNSKNIKSELIDIVKNSKYGKSGYFWINDLEPRMIMHPIKPSLNGKDLSTIKDPKGKKLFVEMAKIAKKYEKGFVDYQWVKPNFNTPQDKVSYIFTFKPFNWVIGTGEYVDNVTKDMQNEALMTISKMKYGKDNSNYFWVNDSYPKMIMHPIKSSLNGKDLSNLEDPNGKRIFVEMSNIAKNKQEGFINYQWAKTKSGKPENKISYVAYFQEWDWVIGTGIYVDDIEREISNMNKISDDKVNNIIFTFFITTIIVLVIAIILLYVTIQKSVIEPLEYLKKGFLKLIESNDITTRLNISSNDEIGDVSIIFNQYMDSIDKGLQKDKIVIDEIKEVVSRVGSGFFVFSVKSSANNENINELKDALNNMISTIKVQIDTINQALMEFGKANFAHKLKIDNVSGEIGTAVIQTKVIGNNVSEIFAMIQQSGDKLGSDIVLLSQASSSLSNSANEQAASLEETAAAIEEITSTIRNNRDNIEKMSTIATELTKSATNGKELASKTAASMDNINEQITSINEAIIIIDQIAFQTNILSLNAAVEAATAGEAGKGFAVVAQEVRNLASRSAEAAKEIKTLVINATDKAGDGKNIAGEMIKDYDVLNNIINETKFVIDSVATSSKEQELGIVQINDTVNSLDKATQINASNAADIANLAKGVEVLSEKLRQVSNNAKFDSHTKNQICDIELVYNLNELFFDHIIFKNNYFSKLNNKSHSSVEAATSCKIGHWILSQEKEGVKFTTTNTWNKLKDTHSSYHNNIQDYITYNSKNYTNEQLKDYANQVEKDILTIFDLINELKVENCKLLD
jgi:methyl-accepting chemotaxis protein